MKSRYFAGLSLAIMAAGFVVTLFLPDNTAVFLLKGGFEAGLVGGIADWFAVTALFRHPMGIPIPHTSLLLKNKDRIVQSLISAMENELLNQESIANKLKKLKILQLAATQMTRLMSRKRTRLTILGFILSAVERLPLEKAVPPIQSWLVQYARNTDLKKLAESAITKAMEEGYDEKALDFVLGEAAKWVERPETGMMLGKLANEKMTELKVGGFMGFAVQAFAGFMNEEKLGGILQNMLVSGLRDLADKDNVHRETVLREIRIQLFQLADDDERLAALQQWAAGGLEAEGTGAFLLARLEDIRRMAMERLEAERLNGGRLLFAGYRAVMRYFSREPERIEEWENRLLDYLLQLVKSNHFRIGRLVKENLEGMDDQSLVRMLEEKVGSDLQWIRVNGALCGFLVGFVLSLIQL